MRRYSIYMKKAADFCLNLRKLLDINNSKDVWDKFPSEEYKRKSNNVEDVNT